MFHGDPPQSTAVSDIGGCEVYVSEVNTEGAWILPLGSICQTSGSAYAATVSGLPGFGASAVPGRCLTAERKVSGDAVLPSGRRRSPETPHPFRAARRRAAQRRTDGRRRLLGRVGAALPPPAPDG